MPARKKVTPPAAEPINWRSKIPAEYIVLNKWAFAEQGINIDELSEEELKEKRENAKDSELLILLQGLKEVAHMRGYSYLDTQLEFPEPGRVVAKCTISFCPTHEQPLGLTVSQTASADIRFMDEKFGQHREAIAENRAVARAIRLGLNIPIVGFDELQGQKDSVADATAKKTQNQPPDPAVTLKNKCEKLGVTIEQVAELINQKWPKTGGKPRNIDSFKKVSPSWAFEIIGEVEGLAAKTDEN